MNAELHRRLTKLGLDLHAGHLDRAALFWLKVFADLAADAGLGVDASGVASRSSRASPIHWSRFFRSCRRQRSTSRLTDDGVAFGRASRSG